MRVFIPNSWQLLNKGTVKVESESVPGKFYYVGLKSLKCSCPSALKGFFCKHMQWVHMNKKMILEEGKGGLL